MTSDNLCCCSIVQVSLVIFACYKIFDVYIVYWRQLVGCFLSNLVIDIVVKDVLVRFCRQAIDDRWKRRTLLAALVGTAVKV